MLSSSRTSNSTPRRPKPPAKARKSTPLSFTPSAPPPPYYAGRLEDFLLDSPIPVTAQLINSAASKAEGIGLPGTPGIDDWMNEKSREELSGLLLKADGIIKSRETELSLTSALCKSLYTDNVTLKSKHESLLARLPGTRSSTPSNSRPTSPFRLDAPSLEQSPSYPGVAFPGSPTEPNQSLAIPSIPARLRRTRRVSVTPGELSMLADQNAELIDKLEQLEAESVKADQAGKRKLRKLEQEIQSLREELDKTQARGMELEEQAKAATHAVAVQKRREEREARMQALKRSTTTPPGSAAPEEEVRDFAPPNWLSSQSSPMKRSFSASTSASTHSIGSDQAYELALGLTPMQEEGPSDQDPDSYFPDSQSSSSIHDEPPQAEFAIVSQLLAKIGELERTNAEIKEQQRMTDERRRAAQWDAESIRRVYDWLDEDDVDLEIQEEDSDSRPPISSKLGVGESNGTIRFSSIRRTIVGDMQRLKSSESDIFAEGISGEMQSTMRDGILKGGAAPKARRTVVGLFDQDPDTSAGRPSWGQYPPSLRVSPAFRSMDNDVSGWSSSANGGVVPPSPTMSTLPTPLEGPHTGRTLGSELGSEFGDDWAQHGINHHLRASSLADLAGLYSSPASPSESVAVLPPIVFPSAEEQEDWNRAGPSTPPPPPKLQVEPPTPTPDKLLRSPAATRQFRLSQTVRSRTNRWVEGRFQPPQQQTSLSERAISKRPSLSTLGRKSTANLFSKTAPAIFSDTFDNAVGQIRRVTSRGSFSPLGFGATSNSGPPDAGPSLDERGQDASSRENVDEDALEEHEGDRSVSLRPEASIGDPLDKKHDGIVGFVLEAWLWLQFIIVVALFLWAMAKRGPKVVLEAERRSAHRAAPKS
ncbi:hypothetical protein L227DRAFT_648411 [Lentinus tigrinus ALCF2SS1-6]|uniref:Uncharacterized protein n=1 Tax=Lentinus tigrinus ALCF2SS1-6 TaxID=1328759 RepID=A0A5C2SV59_9APHY|nr:hypothetical protein L227DRAFT_648411 [Lentinus tigrinus ALCF2SS1-6]